MSILYSLQTHFKSFTFVRQYFQGANVNTSYSGLNKKGAVEEGASVAHEFQWAAIIPKTRRSKQNWWISRDDSVGQNPDINARPTNWD